MNIKLGLILCAGKGTRMGPIGKLLPKPLWPLFERTLLDWQIIQMKKLGIEKIFINVHHGAELIEDYINQNWPNQVTILKEEPLLNVGGAVSNLKIQTNSSEKILVVTADMLIELQKSDLEKIEETLKHDIACLLLMKVDPSSKYNKILFDHEKVLEIRESNSDNFTFSGVSVINLDKIEGQTAPQTFFEELLNYKENKVKTYFNANINFFDLGTLNEFVETHEKVLEISKINPQSLLINDLFKFSFLSVDLRDWTQCSFKFVKIKRVKQGLLIGYEGLSQEIELSISKS